MPKSAFASSEIASGLMYAAVNNVAMTVVTVNVAFYHNWAHSRLKGILGDFHIFLATVLLSFCQWSMEACVLTCLCTSR